MVSPGLYGELLAWLDGIALIVLLVAAASAIVAAWDRHSRALRGARSERRARR